MHLLCMGFTVKASNNSTATRTTVRETDCVIIVQVAITTVRCVHGRALLPTFLRRLTAFRPTPKKETPSPPQSGSTVTYSLRRYVLKTTQPVKKALCFFAR